LQLATERLRLAELRLAAGHRFVDEKQTGRQAEEKINAQAIATQDTYHE